ncbi:MAG: tRNA (guanosine(46)-N7)-methyltransferase TrmB [Clostridiales bacterium]|nr:tRNA (guanosine(46)-N7)-methyltransferase TrmB [Clostridiales bacterium]
MRVRKKNWAEGELAVNTLILDVDSPYSKRWHEYFGNLNPIYVEIGSGKCGFITQMAQKFPDINFIAFEREQMVIVNGARKIRELNENGENIKNIVFICADAMCLRAIFEKHEISRLFLNFSDPWPRRKKWAKRRLTHRNFLNVYQELLVEFGEIHMKTDNTVLFEFSLNEFSQTGWGLKNITLDLHNSPFAKDNIMTEYETKFSERGMPIYRLEAEFPNKNAVKAYESYVEKEADEIMNE